MGLQGGWGFTAIPEPLGGQQHFPETRVRAPRKVGNGVSVVKASEGWSYRRGTLRPPPRRGHGGFVGFTLRPTAASGRDVSEEAAW